MKHVIQCIAWCLTLCLSQQLFSQTSGIPYTAEYTLSIEKVHILEKDSEGNKLKAIYIVPGSGKHSVLGNVTTMSIVRSDDSAGKGDVEFTQTDTEGNSLFINSNLILQEDGTMISHGVIKGGTGKYKLATGNYIGTGLPSATTSTWKTEGTIYFNAEEDEKSDIKKVIAAGTKAYYKNDMEAWSNIQSQGDYNGGIYVLEPGAALIQRGQEFQQTIKSYPRPQVIPKVERTNWDIQVRGDVAWASFEQTTKVNGQADHSIESRILEKINGEWKIAFTTAAFHNNTDIPGNQDESQRLICVHEIELNPGVDPQEFESFVMNTFGPIYSNMEGQDFILTKADKGVRNGKYSFVVILDSPSVRNRIYPETGESPEDWGGNETWVKARAMFTGLGETYSDYVELKK